MSCRASANYTQRPPEEASTAGAAAAPNIAAAGGSADNGSAENGSGKSEAAAHGKAASSAGSGTKAAGAGTKLAADTKPIGGTDGAPEAGTGTTPAELRKNTGEYRTVTDAEELEAVIAEAEAQGFAAFDCETTGLNPLYDALVGFSLSLKAGTGIYVPLKAPAPELGEQPFTVMPLATAKELLARLWSNESLTLILHNGKFDYQVLRTAKIFTRAGCRLFDTMIAAWLLEPDTLSFGLENLAESQLGLQGINYKDVVPKGHTFAAVPLPQATEYAAEDADFTLQLYHIYKPALEQANLTALFETLEMPLMPLLADMEAQGIFLKKETCRVF